MSAKTLGLAFPEARGPRGSDDRSGSSEGESVDGSHCPSNSWGGVNDDPGYEASDSSRVSIREDASHRLSGFWERESAEDSCFRGSWQRHRASDEKSSCCSSSDPCVGASEDRRSSRGLGSTPPQSPSPRTKDLTMPGVANSGPSKSSREAADSCESFCCHPLSWPQHFSYFRDISLSSSWHVHASFPLYFQQLPLFPYLSFPYIYVTCLTDILPRSNIIFEILRIFVSPFPRHLILWR